MAIPQDGRLTSQNILTGTLLGTEVMYIVSPGNAAQGQSYQITTATLAAYFAGFNTSTPTIIKTGSSYPSVSTDTRILMDLTVATPFTITMLASTNYSQPILVKDIAGNLSGTDTLTINFSGGQTADGETSIVLTTPYDGIWLNPLAAGGFYITQA
jgi:hypothetical protein